MITEGGDRTLSTIFAGHDHKTRRELHHLPGEQPGEQPGK